MCWHYHYSAFLWRALLLQRKVWWPRSTRFVLCGSVGVLPFGVSAGANAMVGWCRSEIFLLCPLPLQPHSFLAISLKLSRYLHVARVGYGHPFSDCRQLWSRDVTKPRPSALETMQTRKTMLAKRRSAVERHSANRRSDSHLRRVPLSGRETSFTDTIIQCAGDVGDSWSDTRRM